MRVIAYSYDADHHCESCMLKYANAVDYDEWVWGDEDLENFSCEVCGT